MDAVQHEPITRRAEDPEPHRAHNERGAGVAAEGQQPLRLPRRDAAAALHVRNVGGPRGISAQKPHHEGRGPRAAHAEKPRGKGRDDPAQQPRQAHPVEIARQHEKRKQRRDQKPRAHLQRLAAGVARRTGVIEHKPQQGDPRRDRKTPSPQIFHTPLLVHPHVSNYVRAHKVSTD